MFRKKLISNTSPVSSIKRAQRESLYYRRLSELVTQVILEDNHLDGLMVTRARLSPDKSSCILYFYTVGGEEAFQKAMPYLILYKPSMRKAMSQVRSGRYVPELVFEFDDSLEKQSRIDELLNDIRLENAAQDNEYEDDEEDNEAVEE